MKSETSLNPNSQQYQQYQRIAAAIEYIQTNFKSQPTLDEIAGAVHLSPTHFQRVFQDWAGVSPKKFCQYLSLEYAKSVLNQTQSSLLDTTHELGLSSSSRLHDLFINIESMTPAEYKNGGVNLDLHYQFANSLFGDVFIASTPRGICKLSFADSLDAALADLKLTFPNANLIEQSTDFHQQALAFLAGLQTNNQLAKSNQQTIELHLKGTPFQLKVWEALLQIPTGKLSTYGSIAQQIGNPKGSRAVGTAIGSNPIAFLIPCHRVIQASGVLGGYRWGLTRKAAMLGFEATKQSPQTDK